MDTYYIYLNCYETSGYFTGIVMSSTGKEVGVHPAKYRAYKFESRDKAFGQARALKATFSCIKSYEVRNY